MTVTPHLRPTLALAAAAALLSGCGSAPTDQSPPAADTDPLTPSESSAPSPSGTPTAAPLPEAADGTDLTACADADCEVVVEEGDEFAMDGSYGVEQFTVESVGADGLSMAGEGPGTMVSGHVPAPPPGGNDHPQFVMNGFSITVVALEGSTAVMRLGT